MNIKKSMILRWFTLCSVIAVVNFWGCETAEQQKKSDQPVIATVGSDEITLDDFRRFYEYDPNFGVDSSGIGALRSQLEKQIDYLLAYQKAQQTGLTDSSYFTKAREWELQQAMLRQLYREMVQSDVAISDADLQQAFREYNTEVRVRHLFSPDYRQIVAWQDSLQNGVPFARLAKQAFRDSTLSANGGELGWQKSGDLEEEFAAVAMQLPPNTVSNPVKTRFGFHLIEVLDRREPQILTESVFESQRPSLEKRLRRKREQVAANQFISEFIGDKNPQPVEQGFRQLWNALTKNASGEQPRMQFRNSLDDQQLATVKVQLAKNLGDPLVQYSGGAISIGDYLASLSQMPLGDRPKFQSPRQFSDHLGIWVRNRFLLEKARKSGLENHPRVTREMHDFATEFAFLLYLRDEIPGISIPDSVAAYFENGRKAADIPAGNPDVRNHHTLQSWAWSEANRRLHSKLRTENAPEIRIDEALLQQENALIDWENRIRMFMIRKPS